MNYKKFGVIFAFFSAFLCMIAGCSARQEDGSEHAYWDASSFIISEDCIEFPCEYGTLKYPARWSNSLIIEREEKKDTEKYTFYYVDGERKAEIARLSFGTEDGFLVGAVNDCKISLQLGDIQSEQWSESDVLNYCAMQEDMNETLAHLTELKGFAQGDRSAE